MLSGYRGPSSRNRFKIKAPGLVPVENWWFLASACMLIVTVLSSRWYMGFHLAIATPGNLTSTGVVVYLGHLSQQEKPHTQMM
jgi:hypothetical protein